MEPILPRVPVRKLWMLWLVTVIAASSVVWIVLGDRAGGWSDFARIGCFLAIGAAIGFAFARITRDGHYQSGAVRAVNSLTNEELFLAALNRELCRARRDDSSFAVLSMDQAGERSDASSSHLCECLNAELRAYADIAQVGERALVLVPEVGDSQYLPMLKRLAARMVSADCGEVRIGLARFPQDAVCAQELIAIADRKRLVRGLSSASSKNHDSEQADERLHNQLST